MSFNTSDLCDKYDDKIQVLAPHFHSFGGKLTCSGKVFTCKLPGNNTTLKELLQTPGRGRVCVVDVDAQYCAVVGDTLMEFAAQNNWSAIIVNGYVRDTLGTQAINVGLFALGSCPKKVSQEKSGECGQTLYFGGVTFCDGDFLYADRDGIILSKEELHI